jgi:hypothetical protein
MQINPNQFVPLKLETRPAIPTDAAAYHLNRKPQTLRVWACKENGPLRPIRINGRLAWSVSEIRALLDAFIRDKTGSGV